MKGSKRPNSHSPRHSSLSPPTFSSSPSAASQSEEDFSYLTNKSSQVSGWDEPPTIDPALLTIPKTDGPVLITYQRGTLVTRSYDPEFLPPPLYPDNKEGKVETTFYHDLVNEYVARRIWQLQANEELRELKHFLARRIARRILAILFSIPSDYDRMDHIKKYIKTQLHDAYLAGDSKLHTMVMLEFKAIATTEQPPASTARDVHLQ